MIMLSGAGAATAADEWRTWKSSSGTATEAKLVSTDGKEAILEKRDGKRITVPLSRLSAEDQAYLAASAPKGETTAKGETTVKGIAAEPGVVSGKIACEADSKWSYFLYLPKAFHSGRKWPVCFVMDPGGGSPGTLGRYIPAADDLGIILAVSTESKNKFIDSTVAMMAMGKDVYQRLPLIEGAAISSGMSGGSRMAYLMAEKDENVAGVLACGSGSGVYLPEGDFRPAKLGRDTMICSLIGTNDFNRREAAKSHKAFGKSARFIWFPGNHDWADQELIAEGMAEVYGKMLKNSKAKSLDPLRGEFAKSRFALVKGRQERKPLDAWRWAEFLAKFPGDPATQREAAELAAALAKKPEVAKAIAAEKAIGEFTEKYFADGDTKGDVNPDASRLKDAEKTAAEFEGLPQAELLKRMGKEVPPP
jgi:hypothetical protein